MTTWSRLRIRETRELEWPSFLQQLQYTLQPCFNTLLQKKKKKRCKRFPRFLQHCEIQLTTPVTIAAITAYGIQCKDMLVYIHLQHLTFLDVLHISYNKQTRKKKTPRDCLIGAQWPVGTAAESRSPHKGHVAHTHYSLFNTTLLVLTFIRGHSHQCRNIAKWCWFRFQNIFL